jgi:hypothetical protein
MRPGIAAQVFRGSGASGAAGAILFQLSPGVLCTIAAKSQDALEALDTNAALDTASGRSLSAGGVVAPAEGGGDAPSGEVWPLRSLSLGDDGRSECSAPVREDWGSPLLKLQGGPVVPDPASARATNAESFLGATGRQGGDGRSGWP